MLLGAVLAIQEAVLEHGLESMMTGAAMAICLYVIATLIVKYLIDGPFEKSVQ